MLDLLQTSYRRTGRTRCLFPQPRQLGVTLRMKLSPNNLMMRNFPRLPPMRWERYSGRRYQGSRKVSSVPNQEEITTCSLIMRKVPIVKFVRNRKTTKTRPKRRGKPKMRVDGIAPSTKLGDLVTADHNFLNVENESRCGRKRRSNRARWIHKLNSELSDEDRKTMSCLQRFILSITEAGNQFTQTIPNTWYCGTMHSPQRGRGAQHPRPEQQDHGVSKFTADWAPTQQTMMMKPGCNKVHCLLEIYLALKVSGQQQWRYVTGRWCFQGGQFPRGRCSSEVRFTWKIWRKYEVNIWSLPS